MEESERFLKVYSLEFHNTARDNLSSHAISSASESHLSWGDFQWSQTKTHEISL